MNALDELGKKCNYRDLRKYCKIMGRTGKSMSRIFRQIRLLAVLTLSGLVWHASAVPASAQYFYELMGMIPPIFSLSNPKGEIRLRAMYVNLASGKETIPQRNLTRSLRDDYGMTSNSLFVDTMARIQAGRFSFRGHLDFCEFTGNRPYGNQPGQLRADARFEYSGFRLGGDFDIVQWYESRIGVNLDYDIYNAYFSEAIYTRGGRKISTAGPITIGAHVVLCPPMNYLGVWPVLEGRARWSVSGPTMTDWEVAGGLRSAETLLGSIALRGGFRSTSLSFEDNVSAINNLPPTRLDVVLDGWFGEVVYYY